VRSELRVALADGGYDRVEDAFCVAQESVAALDNRA
jgi:hypothetical protein